MTLSTLDYAKIQTEMHFSRKTVPGRLLAFRFEAVLAGIVKLAGRLYLHLFARMPDNKFSDTHEFKLDNFI